MFGKITIFELPYSEVINRGQREAITRWQFIFNRIILIANIMEEEVWKDIPDYEGLYQVSNFGNIKSLPKCKSKNWRSFYTKEKILKLIVGAHGYIIVNLSKNEKQKLKKVHQIVAYVFLNHRPCGHRLVINHKDFNRANNRLDNLEIITQRKNANKKHIPHSSKYTGVYWYKEYQKWTARICINGKQKSLGYYLDEDEAGLAYEKKLKQILEDEP